MKTDQILKILWLSTTALVVDRLRNALVSVEATIDLLSTAFDMQSSAVDSYM